MSQTRIDPTVLLRKPMHPLLMALILLVNIPAMFCDGLPGILLNLLYTLNFGSALYCIYYYWFVIRKAKKLFHQSDDKVPPIRPVGMLEPNVKDYRETNHTDKGPDSGS